MHLKQLTVYLQMKRKGKRRKEEKKESSFCV